MHPIKEKVPESVIKLMSRGNISTNMNRISIYLIRQDIDSAMLESYDISVTDNDNAASWLEPFQFPHYQRINPPVSNYYFSPGQRLTYVVIDTDEGIQQSVHNNLDIMRQLIDERIAEMKRKGEL